MAVSKRVAVEEDILDDRGELGPRESVESEARASLVPRHEPTSAKVGRQSPARTKQQTAGPRGFYVSKFGDHTSDQVDDDALPQLDGFTGKSPVAGPSKGQRGLVSELVVPTLKLRRISDVVDEALALTRERRRPDDSDVDL